MFTQDDLEIQVAFHDNILESMNSLKKPLPVLEEFINQSSEPRYINQPQSHQNINPRKLYQTFRNFKRHKSHIKSLKQLPQNPSFHIPTTHPNPKTHKNVKSLSR